MASATERWSDRQLHRSSTPTAIRGFDVVNATDESDAISAVGISINDLHPQDTSLTLRASGFDVDLSNPGLYHVIVKYKKGEHDDDENPLDVPPDVGYKDVNKEVEFDVDKDGNPIVNSAREAPLNAPRDFVTDFILTVKKNEPFYDPILAKDLRLSVNQTPLTINGVQIADSLEARLMKMSPTGFNKVNAAFVNVTYEWLIIHTENAPSGVSPHATRLKDVGYRAWGLDDASADVIQHLYTRNAASDPEDKVTTPVALDGKGAPISTSYAIGPDDLTKTDLGTPTGATLETQTDMNFLWYDPPKLEVKDHVGRLDL